MADIQYLNYGDLQIELLALLNNLANLVQGYVQKQPWSNKRKEMFMSAYSELMNRGILGASNATGQWMLNVGGDTPLNLDSKSKKEKEMYLEAAYFIQQQMAGLPTKTSQEEKKKEDLPVFDNKYFTSELIKHISNKDYGGLDILMGNGEKENDWNRLDARDEKGIRGRKNRADALARYLREYSDSLDESKLNFEGSPFANLNDFKGRINKAIEALGTESTEDDIPALNAIGLSASTWFNNGSGDPYKTTGYEGTYGDYYGRFLPQLEKDKAKAEAEKLKAIKANYWSGYKYYNLSKYNGRPLTSEESNLEHLNKIISKDKWSGDEASQIVQAFKLAERNGQLVSITDKNELAKFGPMWKNRVRQLRKINGIEGIYYDTVGKKFVKPYKNGQTPLTSFLDILDKNNPERKKEQDALTKKMALDKYLANTEWTPDKTRELIGIAADVASVIDPEPISAAGLALGGTGLRAWNRFFDEDGVTLSDIGHTILDTGLSALGAIPLVGDATLSARILSKLQKASGWLGILFAAGSVPLAAKAAWNKVVNGQDMTVDDWRAIGNVIMGFTLARRMWLNNSAGKVIQRGETVNENSPLRVQKTAEHFNKDSWNIRQKASQGQIKGPWYKKVWNYFKDPYANISTPIIQHGNLPQPPKPKLDILKPIPTLGPYYRKQGGIIDKQKIQKYKEFIKK